MGDADQVGGEGQVHCLGVGRHEEGQEEQAKEDQVEVEVETLQKKLSQNSSDPRLLPNESTPGAKPR